MQKSEIWLLIFRCLLIGSLLTAAISVYAHFFGGSPKPSSVQIKLTDMGTIADFKFEVRRYFYYSFSMRFGFPENDKMERARVRKLLGGHAIDKTGRPVDPGVPTPINLTIFAICKDGREVEIYSRDMDPILTYWGRDNFGKNIGSHILTPGMYRARLVSKRAAPEFSSVPVTFELGMPAKVNFRPTKEPTRSDPCQQ